MQEAHDLLPRCCCVYDALRLQAQAEVCDAARTNGSSGSGGSSSSSEGSSQTAADVHEYGNGVRATAPGHCAPTPEQVAQASGSKASSGGAAPEPGHDSHAAARVSAAPVGIPAFPLVTGIWRTRVCWRSCPRVCMWLKGCTPVGDGYLQEVAFDRLACVDPCQSFRWTSPHCCPWCSTSAALPPWFW